MHGMQVITEGVEEERKREVECDERKKCYVKEGLRQLELIWGPRNNIMMIRYL
jgi:hypothetical protein